MWRLHFCGSEARVVKKSSQDAVFMTLSWVFTTAPDLGDLKICLKSLSFPPLLHASVYGNSRRCRKIAKKSWISRETRDSAVRLDNISDGQCLNIWCPEDAVLKYDFLALCLKTQEHVLKTVPWDDFFAPQMTILSFMPNSFFWYSSIWACQSEKKCPSSRRYSSPT